MPPFTNPTDIALAPSPLIKFAVPSIGSTTQIYSLLTACLPANKADPQQGIQSQTQKVYLCTKTTITSGNVVEIADASYDANGNLVLLQLSRNGEIFDTTRYTYDDNNNILTEVGIHPDGHETYRREYTYSDQGYHVVRKSYDSNGNLSHESTSSYDTQGRLLRDGDAVYSYDDSGNKIKEESLTLNSYTTFLYDDNNKLLTQIYVERDSERNRYEKSYDPQGNLLIDSHIENGVEIDRFAYSYDRNGNQTEKKYFEYDALKYHTTFTYDDRGNLLEQVVLELATGNKTTTTYTYDLQNRKLSEDFVQGGQPYRYTWTYDEFGNLVNYSLFRDGVLTGCADLQYEAIELPTEQAQKVIQQQKSIINQ